MTLPIRIKTVLRDQPVGRRLEIHGWLRTRRDAKGGFSFLELNDGSCLANLQVIADSSLENYTTEIARLTTGCCLRVRGILVQSPAKGQPVELRAERVEVLGTAPAEHYPLQKKRHSFEFLRTIPHLRPRTNSIAAVARIRSSLAMAVHHFFQERGFIHVHTPIITTSDCEGAGAMFTVTAVDLDHPPRLRDGGFDYRRDFFGRRAGLTVSGQLEAEAYALALGNVYTFGPTFRAEHSNTKRHLAEFWMVEPEMAFCDLGGDIDLAESFLKELARCALEECTDDLALFARFIDASVEDRLRAVCDREFVRMSYSEAIEHLAGSGRSFQFPVEWGCDLQAEHERYLCEELCKGPVVVYDYPAAIKPFYMRANDDGRTVAAMDVLLPGIGEIIGGSQREERLDVLEEKMTALGMNLDDYRWYLDLRRYGTAPHAGFGLGFERLIQFVTGLPNIRETIPFPRTPK